MSLDTAISSQASLFDEEILDLLLDDNPPDSPALLTSTSLALVDSAPVLDEILNAVYSENYPRCLTLINWLLRSNLTITETSCLVFTEAFERMIPNQPIPVIDEALVEYQALPGKIITLLVEYDATAASARLQLLDYRLLEGCGEYAKARQRIAVLMEESNDPFSTAQLTNNYGYEFLLEGNYALARPYFVEAIEIFAELLDEDEVANAQANLLTCEFELATQDEFESLMPMLLEAHTRLYQLGDWRRRKTMRLLAARAEAGERLLAAVAWARRAVSASRGIESRLREDDLNYLNRLRRKLNRRSSPVKVIPLQRKTESNPGAETNHG